MFNILEKIKKDSFEKSSNEDKATLITSLMIECAKSDDNFSEEEIGLIKNILKKKLELSEEETDKCFNDAIEQSDKSVEIYSLTKEIRDNFSKEEILIMFEYLWQIILSDEIVDDFEASMMTKLTGLFHLTGQESSESKENARALINKKI